MEHSAKDNFSCGISEQKNSRSEKKHIEDFDADGIGSSDTEELVEISQIEAEALEAEEDAGELEDNIEETIEEDTEFENVKGKNEYVEEISNRYYDESEEPNTYKKFEELVGPSEHSREKPYLEASEIALLKRRYQEDLDPRGSFRDKLIEELRKKQQDNEKKSFEDINKRINKHTYVF